MGADKFPDGFVMLDNTTLFGAARAFEWAPQQPYMPSGVDLRSLMDVLEAIILVDDFGVDRSSREQAINWPELHEISGTNGGFFHEHSLERLTGPSHAALTQTVIMQLQRMLTTGELIDHLGFMPSSDDVEILPPLYRDAPDFAQLTLHGINGGERAMLAQQLDEFAQVLRRQHSAVQNFAYFAFRGFYYQMLAHNAGVSYMPHAWRSALVRSQLSQPPTRFADFVMKSAGSIRSRARDHINEQFGFSAVSADFPLLASYIISQCDTRGALLKTAAEIRCSSKVASFRDWICRLERNIRDQGNLLAIRQAQEELRALIHELEQDLGLKESEKQKVTLAVGFPMISAQTDAQLPRRPRWSRPLLRRRPHLVFLRELARESARLAPFSVAFRRLGE